MLNKNPYIPVPVKVIKIIDEVDTHQRLAGRPLRSLKPVGVIQELYGLLIAHYAVRVLMHEAALEAQVDPDRLSFVHALEVIRSAVPEFQMIDPSVPQQTGFGGRSQSLEIVVDTVPPPVFFGSAADPADGLTPDPGVTPQPPTFVDNKTNDRTPTFWGTAEADAIIRVWADLTPDNGADNFDVLLGLTVAEPLDGTNQFPNGQWRVTSTVDLNDPAFFPLDGLRRILVTAEDPAGNTAPPAGIAAQFLEIFVDTQGPQVFGVFFPRDPTLVGVGRGNNTLVRFQASAPGTILATVPMVGLAAGEIVVGIDVRPATGQLYAVADGPVTDRLYTVEPFTGVATFVADLTTPLNGTAFGVDFNPVADRLRVVSDADQNLRIHPDTGNVTVDAVLNPADVSYLFFLAKGDGSHAFAFTYEEHLQNQELYRR
mgnify:CR=1 FL=1